MTDVGARLIGINHVALEVDDIDEALEFSGRLLRFELRGRSGWRMAFLDAGDQFVALPAAIEQLREKGLIDEEA